ncbi:type II toxin-antitoxin system RelE/ParE family toxin [Methylophilus sp. 5]|uniref:type II toxin-antitoxin system RelE/ParE family toxin n=1 Tax=Methylophilus sp. 5 TaxID=1112274 RepID=UPI000491CBFD|nr:type II toxin-antitoxin system RelE/ParE family toxin [Methylophilus sp. 5]
MKLRFHPEAVLELREAIFYYEHRQIGLGKQLNQEIKSTVELIKAHSQAWIIIGNNIRRTLVRRFPYGVLYTVEKDEIHILAIMHLNREPNYWKDRS